MGLCGIKGPLLMLVTPEHSCCLEPPAVICNQRCRWFYSRLKDQPPLPQALTWGPFRWQYFFTLHL